jgi:thymidylate kinase
MFNKVYNNQNRLVTNVFTKVIYLKRLLKQPGYTMAFLGTDGAGKSTIIENIRPILNEAFHNGIYYEHLRPNMIPSIAKLFRKNEILDGPVINPHAKNKSGLLGSLLRWNYYLIDYTLGYFFKIFPRKAFRSCVWIFDRYYYDYLIDKRRTRVNLPSWLLKMGKLIIPEPDIIICLGAEPNIIYKRKPELSIQEVNRQVKELKMFCNSNNKAVWIDTGVSIEQSVDETMRLITKIMSHRFK